MELNKTFVSALLVALLSLTSALSHAAHPNELAPGLWPTFGGEVHDILILPDDSFIVVGEFGSVTINGVQTNRTRIAHINANLTLDTNFPTANGDVLCVASDAAGRIYLGGDFTTLTVGSTTTNHLRVARLTSAFAIDTAFNTSAAGPTDDVYALAPAGDGSVYIGGHFNAVGAPGAPESADSKRFAKLKANGALDTAVKSGATNDVNSILRLPNGTLYVGGITNYWGLKAGQFPLPTTPYARLVKLSAGGARDAAFKSPDIFTIINDIVQLPNGNLFVAGNNLGQSFVKRMHPGTGADLGYAVTGHLSQANCVAAQGNDMLYSGALGTFFLTNSTGVKDANFDVGAAFNSGMINTVKLDKNGRVYIGGAFTYNDGVNPARSRFVVLNGYDPRSQSITFPAVANPTFKAPNNVFTLGATSSSGLPVSYAVTSGNATLAGNKLTILGAGTVVVTATQAGNATFDPATPNALNIFVPLEAQTISFAPLIDRPTGSPPFLLSASSTSGLTVTYDVIAGPADVDDNVLTLTGQPGIVTIRAEQEGNVDYLAAAPVEQSFEVFTGFAAPLAQTIIFNPLPARFANESAFGVSAVSTSGLPVTLAVTAGGSIASIVGNTVTLSGQTGDVTITATQAGNINFLAAKSVVQKFKVNAAATALTLTDLLQTYDGSPKDIGVVGGVANTIFYTINKVKGTTPPTAAGSYAVEAVAGTVKKTGTLVIAKAPLIVAAADQRKFVGQANPALTFAFSGFIGNDHAGNSFTKAVTVTTKATATSPGGSYPITPAGGLANNYALVYVNGNLQVESWAGQYEALIETPGGDLPVGKLEITVLANSIGFTGKLTTAKGAAASFKGDLTRNLGTEVATATVNGVVGTGATAVTYGFDLGLPLMDDFTATVTRKVGAGAAAPFGDTTIGQKIHLPTGIPPAPHAGAHTLIMEYPTHLTGSLLPLPKGSSHATATIDPKGKMTIAGVLADGTKLTASLFPDFVRGYRLYALPYAAGRLDSYAAAWLNLMPHPDLPGRGYIPVQTQAFYWAKSPSSKDLNYRDGFPETSGGLILDPWLPPATKPAIVTLRQRLVLNASGEMDVIHSDLPGTLNTTGLPALVTMDAAGKVIVPTTNPNNPRAWKVTIAPATGAFAGSHTVLDGTKSLTVNFSGVMRQPPSTEVGAHVIGVGFEIVPQLNGQTAGTTSNEISFERTAAQAP